MDKLKEVLNKGSDNPSLWTEDSILTKCQFFPTWHIDSMQFQLKKPQQVFLWILTNWL